MRIPRSLQDSIVVRLFLALWLAVTPTFVWAGSMTLLGAGGTAAATGATLAFDTFATEAAGTSTSTFNGTNIGTAASNRVIVVIAMARVTATASTTSISSMTIGGNAATHVASSLAVISSQAMASDIWYYADGGALGTSTNIVINWAQANTRTGIYVYSVGTSTPTPNNGNNTTSAGATSINAALTVPINGIGVAGVTNQNTGSTMSFTNATQDSSNAMSGGNSTEGGHTTSTGSVTVTGTSNVLNVMTMSLASWGP